MANPLMVFEDIDTTPRQKIFSFLGIPWYVTPLAWTSIPQALIGGLFLAYFLSLFDVLDTWVLYGVVYGVILLLINTLHSVGHIISGKLVGHPMDGNLVTATRHINLYSGTEPLPSSVHLGRAIGGPAINILFGLFCLLLAIPFGGHLLVVTGILSIFFGAGALAPIYSLDGEVVFRELGHKTTA